MLPKDLVAASMRPLVLTLLSQEEGYGYVLIQRMRALSGGQLSWTEGTLYPVLHKMEAAGLIKSEWRKSDAGRRRKYYLLTEAGHEVNRTERENWQYIDGLLNKLWNRNNT